MTRSNEVSSVEPTLMVLRSRTRGGRSSAAIPDVEIRPETETRPETEIDNPVEIQVSMSAICEEGLGVTRSYIPETASQYVTADKPETTAAFPVSQELVVKSNPNLTPNPNPPLHSLPVSDVASRQHLHSASRHLLVIPRHRKPIWSDNTPVDVASKWKEDWQSNTVTNKNLISDPTIRLPGFNIQRPT